MLTRVSVCAGGVGVPALPVEDDPGGHRCGVHRGSPTAAALLAARVGRQGHLHTHLSEGRTHTAAQEHGEKTLVYFHIDNFSCGCCHTRRKSHLTPVDA